MMGSMMNVWIAVFLLLTLLQCALLVTLGYLWWARQRSRQHDDEDMVTKLLSTLMNEQQKSHQMQQQMHQQHLQNMTELPKMVQNNLQGVATQLTKLLTEQSQAMTKQVTALTEKTDKQLHQISDKVEQRLNSGFEKTQAVFVKMIDRLKIIDYAQQKISELSNQVVDLKSIFSDKRSRGALGEVQLMHLVKNTIPANGFSLQYTFSNDCRVDCLLHLPEPTGDIAIDAKFPLESYRQLLATKDDAQAVRQFKQDIKRHVDDIAKKYIIAGETADSAILFLPSEAIFSEIHAYHPEIIEYAYRMKIWIVSPTTMMAILTTSSSVLKDAETKKHIHTIQEHMRLLNQDFSRFRIRMDKLAKHIKQSYDDVGNVLISSQKISQRFEAIEQVQVDSPLLQEITTEDTTESV